MNENANLTELDALRRQLRKLGRVVHRLDRGNLLIIALAVERALDRCGEDGPEPDPQVW